MVSVVAVTSYQACVPVGTWCPSWRLILPSLRPCRDMVSVVAVNPTELASLRDMVLIVAVTSYRACFPAGHGAHRGGYILPSLCPCRDMKIVVGDVLYRTVVPSGHIPVRCQTQGTATVTNSPVRGQSSVEWAPPFSPLVPQGRKLGRTGNGANIPRPDRDETKDEKQLSHKQIKPL